jgi:hypothetical protein
MGNQGTRYLDLKIYDFVKDVFNFTLFKIEREDYRYSGSENEEEEPAIAGEPSSIVQAPGGDTLRRNFQQIQVLIPSGHSLYNNICILFWGICMSIVQEAGRSTFCSSSLCE